MKTRLATCVSALAVAGLLCGTTAGFAQDKTFELKL